MITTSESLLDQIRKGASFPNYQGRLKDEDLLAFADQETQIQILPMMLSLREDFFVFSEEVPVTAGVSTIPLPQRAIGRVLREVTILDANQTYYNLSKLPIEDVWQFQRSTTTSASVPNYFYLKGDKLILVPTPSSSDVSLTLTYFFQPSQLVKSTLTSRVLSTTSHSITLTTLPPAGFATNALVDVLEGEPIHTPRHINLAITGVSGNTLSFAEEITAVPGDFVSLAGKASVVMLPTEVIGVLVQATICKTLEALGLVNELKVSQDRLMMRIRAANALLAPRVEGAKEKVINRQGILRRTWGRRFPSVRV